MSLGIDRTRTLRGTVCGLIAAGVWALGQPLDKLVFSSRYDDIELLGKALTHGDGWYQAGLALHIQNGAIFGAVYSNLAPILPVHPALRGPLVAMAEHLALWPLGAVCDRVHPRREELSPLAGNRRAFAQATWRHLVFGVVLGELERRLNAEPEPAPPLSEAELSGNGHGPLEQIVSFEPAP